MSNFLQRYQERKNAMLLIGIPPSTTLFDMYHNFSRQSRKEAEKSSNAFSAIIDAYSLDSYDNIEYKKTNAQNKVLLHAVAFKKLYEIYMKYTNCFFEKLEKPIKKETRPIIDVYIYNNMPKRYRGVFSKYDNNHYVLNVTGDKSMVIDVRKSDVPKLEFLLHNVKMQIAKISKLSLHDYSHFVDDGRVTKEQIDTIFYLHDTFMKISKITMPRAVKPTDTKTSGALEIYNEYWNELTQRNILLNTQKDVKLAKERQEKAVQDERKIFDARVKTINDSYKKTRAQILMPLAKKISTRIK